MEASCPRLGADRQDACFFHVVCLRLYDRLLLTIFHRIQQPICDPPPPFIAAKQSCDVCLNLDGCGRGWRNSGLCHKAGQGTYWAKLLGLASIVHLLRMHYPRPCGQPVRLWSITRSDLGRSFVINSHFLAVASRTVIALSQWIRSWLFFRWFVASLGEPIYLGISVVKCDFKLALIST